MLSSAARCAVLLAAAGVPAAACSRSGPPQRPNVLLVTIDTLRADRVGTGTTPAIDALVASGFRFTAARSAVPLTLPSHATILTGLLPPQHGVRENGAGALPESHPTIARALKEAGYRTAAFVGAFVLDRRFGLAQGFDVYDDQIPRDPRAAERLEAERPASAVADRAIAWLQTAIRNPQSAFFIWIHFYDPHAPYTPPPEYASRAKTAYDGEVMFADAQLARVIDALRANGTLDRTLVVVAGDHGEGLGDHGERTHGMLLYDSTLRVPLVIAGPGRRAATIADAVSLSEIAPTILRAVGMTPPAGMKGRDLLQLRPADSGTPAAAVPRPTEGTDLYSETEYPRAAGWSPLQALTDGRWKTIAAGGATEIYDLSRDPREEHDLSASQATTAAAMRGRVEAIHERGAAAEHRVISADAQERLRALGYVASSGEPPPAGGSPNPAKSIAAWNDFEDALSALNAGKPSAVDALETLAAAHPDALVFQSTYARALKDTGRTAAALAVYRDAARRWPTDATLLHDLAVAARDAAASADAPLARSLRDEALRADRAALVLDPDSAVAFNGLGLLAADEDRPGDAARAFERAAALDPNNASYWANLGNARRAAGDRSGAEQAYRRAVEVDASLADAANGLGVLLVEAQRPAEAVSWFERALAAAPEMVEARLNLGIALQQSGDPTRAAAAYRAVLASARPHAREREAAQKLLAALGARQ
jgi:arylsulfatase A-like enzyme/Tfp pilus assembly protein PilF